MGLISGYEYIIKNSEGKLYNFYLNEKKQIEYIATDKENRWAEKNIVNNEPIDSFSVDIDQQDSLHMLSYCKKGNVHYHRFLKNDWIHKKVISYSSDTHGIYYPYIKVIDNHINIFYYLYSDNQRNACNLIHHTLDKDHVWQSKSLFKVNYGKFINPFYILLKKNSIAIVFSSLIDEFNQIFLASFDHQLEELQSPIQITDSSIEKIYIYGLIVNKDIVHIAWSEFDEKGLTIKYKKLWENQSEEVSQILSLSEKSNSSFPILLSYNNILWCTWTQMNRLYACYSKDEGTEWSFAAVREESQQINFKLYSYLTNYSDDRNNIICHYLYGSLYPQIQFLGFGGEVK